MAQLSQDEIDRRNEEDEDIQENIKFVNTKGDLFPKHAKKISKGIKINKSDTSRTARISSAKPPID